MKKSVKYLSYAFRFAAIGVFIGLIISLIINYLGKPDSFFSLILLSFNANIC
ncbi:hypothetical protein [uncultured Lactobacillus sp.]|uniref:hypothetical protein n=1 Tax=uncultured Lactobacillus sp. TaxID=153152 RepID=UPI0025D4DA5B|nr:hypothetical protein [uncultured Lactobacillus sp.]